jgi:hypothetical protein
MRREFALLLFCFCGDCYEAFPLMQATKLSEHTIEAIRDGKPVRRRTLERLKAAMDFGDFE